MIESKPTTSDLFYVAKSSILITWAQFGVGVAFYVLSYYLVDEAFGYWSTDMVTSANIFKFMVGLLLLPLGFILWQSAIFRLSSHTGYHWIINLIFLSLFTIALFTIGAVYFVKWGIQDWLQWDANFSSTALVQLMQGVFLVLTMWLTGITVFNMLLRAILMRNLYTADAQINAGINQDPNAEQKPLISSNTKLATRKDSDTPVFDPKSEAYDKLFEYLSVFLFFFVFLPIFLWINCVNVSDWHRMYPDMIITKLASTTGLTDNWNIYFQFSCGLYSEIGVYETETCYARLYYDVFYWYLFVFIVSIFSYTTCKYAPLKLWLRKRLYFGLHLPFNLGSLISMTIGEIIFWILWLIMMVCIGQYFITIHLFDDDDTKTLTEKWARYVGIMSIQFLSMSLFCSTRIRLWSDCFMLSFERVLCYHRLFGYVFIISGYIHLILWIVFFIESGEETYGPFTVPLSYHTDNFTPIIMYYVMIFIIPFVYVIGAFFVIRRKYFELFYYLHLFGALVMISCILWHASQAWRYMIAPLSLYAIDRMLRMANSSRVSKVESLSISGSGITKLVFSVGCYSTKYNEAQYNKLRFRMGQYVFINISNVSLYQWHPFTICSGENESECYLQIQGQSQAQGDDEQLQFTNMVNLLADRVRDNEIGNHEIELHVDGPYGTPFDYDGYSRVILIAGGIGITPCHSIFSTMLSRAIEFDANVLPFVDLIWVTRDSRMFSMFARTWRMYEDHNNAANNKLSVRLFATLDRDGHQNDDDDIVPETDATMYTYGRPDWSTVLNIIKHQDNDPKTTLVFACGPETLVNEVEKYAVKFGAKFHSESFLF